MRSKMYSNHQSLGNPEYKRYLLGFLPQVSTEDQLQEAFDETEAMFLAVDALHYTGPF